MKRFVLIDANALVHRAFHALPPLRTPDGLVTNAVFGFASVLLKMIKDLKPDHIAAAFDLAGPTFRHDEFEDYKAHRVKAPNELYAQMPLVKELLTHFGIPIFEKEGYEADDLIGTLATKLVKGKEAQVTIVTGDLDALQLVTASKITVFTLRKGVTDTITYNEKAVKERYGGLKPNQLIDYKGLRGDPSDNIPGVPGVGEKTAITLLAHFGSIEKMYARLEKENYKLPEGVSEKLRQKLIENKESAVFSKYLATIVTDLDLDFSLATNGWRKGLNLQGVKDFFNRLHFSSLVKRAEEVGVVNSGQTEIELAVKEKNEATEALGVLPGNFLGERVVALLLSGGEFWLANSTAVIKIEADLIAPLFGEADLEIITFQAKAILRERGLPEPMLARIFDLEIGAYLINPDIKNYGLDQIIQQELGKANSTDAVAKVKLFPELKARLWEKLKNLDLIEIFESVEMPLIPILTQMERAGIKIDPKAIKTLARETEKTIAKLEKQIYKHAGQEFNINSPQQLGQILYDDLAIKGRVRKTSGGARSTAAGELEKIVDAHPIVPLILDYREVQKLNSTYIKPFPKFISSDSRLHTTFNQVGAGTGRLSSEEPNLQNIPTRSVIGREFRRAFIASPGAVLLSGDYSQLELRIVAHLSQDETLKEAFAAGQDIHTRTAAEIFEVPPDKVTKAQRRQAKVMNFGVLYGMGVLAFARAAGVDRVRAREFIDRYFEEFSGVRDYIDKIRQQVSKDGFVTTEFGRRRFIPEVSASAPFMREQGFRMAVNFPVQGTAADVVKMAMIRVAEYLKENFPKGEVKLLLQIHDELIFEVKEELSGAVSKKLVSLMEAVDKLSLPLTVEAKQGLTWADLK
ncbi:MAG: DNA polymerase I [Candidatus Yanofskybacteria bacterium CG10_big_fil_rev_8_21_14_0_10_46_23]|uniref:DNA-directed DNA polymerase n=1 Tax=Candidatus Yanofskybacteria bacterium CG10_big_fil_rev_8_21_14_0_10_46_23 TaxID=1975098 RepID=A0A2H0R429_9BACT|nr:MAG: DNA polymerase I [Candidatus Yanofskybacteria bacterium CG10_big_fil_rev_8_21_14_0_10_46_23]